MVELMLKGLASHADTIQVCHVDARFAQSLEEVGGLKLGKFILLLRHVFSALWLRLTTGADTLYYIPAPPKTSAILRDLVALALLRPFFPRLVLHWHALGLGEWVQEQSPGFFLKIARTMLRKLLRHADPSIVLTESDRRHAAVFSPKRICVVHNGIPDPDPAFDEHVTEDLQRRTNVLSWISGAQPQQPGECVRVMFLGHFTESKGFFDAVEGCRLAACSRPELRWTFTLAGTPLDDGLDDRRARALADAKTCPNLHIHLPGFMDESKKNRAYREHDVVLFPSHSESFGLVAVESLAHGTPVIGSQVSGLIEVLAHTECLLVPPGEPRAIADALLSPAAYAEPRALRNHFLKHFVYDTFIEQMRVALV